MPDSREKIPLNCPITAIRVVSAPDEHGNKRELFIAMDRNGQRVETIEAGHMGPAALLQRYPWFDSWAARTCLDGTQLEEREYITITVQPDEYDAQMGTPADSPLRGQIVTMADAVQRHGWTTG